MTSTSSFYVWVYLPGQALPVPAGILEMREGVDGRTRSRFRYGDRYVERPDALVLDPVDLDFRTHTEPQWFVPSNDKSLFGAFRDATPDSWGQRVIEARLGTRLQQPDWVYLAQAGNERVGALAFTQSLEWTEPFKSQYALTKLLKAAQALDDGLPVDDAERRMLDPGSSMGGARPKAHVVDAEGEPCLAKFPRKDDNFSYAHAENLALEIARGAGMCVADTTIVEVARRPVLLVKRFDRYPLKSGGAGRRMFVSALTLLNREEIESPKASYKEMANAIRRYSVGVRVREDLLDLYKRMALNCLVCNNDDHLRNHGFVYRDGGWQLSPLYDVVPSAVRETAYLHLWIGEQGKIASLENCLTAAGDFGLTPSAARAAIDAVVQSWSRWPVLAKDIGMSSQDQKTMAEYFQWGAHNVEWWNRPS